MYSDELADVILERIANGESIKRICDEEGMPDRKTWYRWLDASPELASKCARAREEQAEYMDELILSTANECDEDTAHSAKVKISAYQWRAAKLAPKKYGERIAQEVSGPDGSPLTVSWLPSPPAGK